MGRMAIKPGKILVLDAQQRSALAAVRSLGVRPELTVYTADAGDRSLAGSSKYSQKYFALPSPAEEPGAYIDQVSKIVDSLQVDFILPVTEISSRTLLEHRERLASVIMPFSSYETVRAVSDKSMLTKKAELLGVPVPASRFYESLSQWNYMQENEFPFVLKPSFSRVMVDGKWISTTVRIVRSNRDLEKYIATDTYLASQPFMIQEYIPGSGAGIFALYDNGSPVCFFSHRRIREKPPGGGVSVFSSSVAVPDDLKEFAHRLLADSGWSGVAMVEFRLAEDGRPYLMEINTRFWGSLQLSIDAGLDFPLLLYRLYTEGACATPGEYQIGRKLRWLLGDLDHLLISVKDNSQSVGQKFKCLLQFLKFNRNTRHEIFRLEDWRPAVYELGEYFRQLISR